MRSAHRTIILLVAVFLSACAPHIAATPTAQPTILPLPASPTPLPTATLAPTLTSAPTASPTPIPPPALPHYTLNVDLNYSQRSGGVEEWIEYTNAASQPLTDLRLMTPLLQYRDAMKYQSLLWSGGALDGQPVENAVIDNIQVVIPLPQPLNPGEKIGLHITYQFFLPSQAAVGGERPLPIGYTERQVNLVDWFPFIAPYRDGTGWLAHPPAYYGENLVYGLSDFDVNLRFVDGRTDLTVAASAEATPEGGWLRYHRESARTFALSVGHQYLMEMTQVGSVMVKSYFFQFNEDAGRRALQTTVEAVELYSELFGPYPHDTLAVVEADFYDGMEYDGLYFLSRAFYNLHKGEAGDYLVAIAAHETAHQWWYGLVGNDQANEPWLDEALCTYTERIYYEFYYPEALAWWREYRIDYYHPTGWVNASVYNQQGTFQSYQDYRNAVYLNGALFLGDLRALIGDDAFYDFLKAYATQYREKIAFQSDFFALLGQYTQADLSPLMQKYFYQNP